jgi:hypothetical protein
MLLISCTGCKDGFKNVLPHKRTTWISVVGDRTDNFKMRPDQQDVLQLFNISDDNIYDSYSLRYKDVEDVSINDVKTLNVQAEYSFLANSNQRIRLIKDFKAKVKELFDASQSNYLQTQEHSLVYRSVISEANYLAKSDADEKYLVVYSDLLDHCEYLDLYNPVTQDLVANHPDQVINSLQKVVKIESLKGVKLQAIRHIERTSPLATVIPLHRFFNKFYNK